MHTKITCYNYTVSEFCEWSVDRFAKIKSLNLPASILTCVHDMTILARMKKLQCYNVAGRGPAGRSAGVNPISRICTVVLCYTAS